MVPDPLKKIRIPIFNPRIMSGCSIGDSTIDELSFVTGLMVGD